jgi:hypothetical protein
MCFGKLYKKVPIPCVPPACVGYDWEEKGVNKDTIAVTDSEANSGTASVDAGTSSSLDSASELLLAAAAAVESGGSEGEAAAGGLCRTVRHLMRSIASIERLMDRVLRHCDRWPAPPAAAAAAAADRDARYSPLLSPLVLRPVGYVPSRRPVITQYSES